MAKGLGEDMIQKSKKTFRKPFKADPTKYLTDDPDCDWEDRTDAGLKQLRTLYDLLRETQDKMHDAEIAFRAILTFNRHRPTHGEWAGHSQSEIAEAMLRAWGKLTAQNAPKGGLPPEKF